MKQENHLRFTSLLLVLLLLFPALKVNAAGFDCTKATTQVEKIICSDTELSKLDEDLNKVYEKALQNTDRAAVIRQEQKQWLKRRNGYTDIGYIKKFYRKRLQELASNAGQDREQPPPKKPLYGFCVDVGIPGSCSGITGKGYTVCEKYLKHLNSLPDIPKCEVPIPPGFSEPEWEEVDYMQHLDWAYRIARNKFLGTNPMSFEQWKPIFLSHIKTGYISPQMRKTRVVATGGNIITLLAFTEDKNGCRWPYNPRNETVYAVWRGMGYLYAILTGNPDEPVKEIGGRISSTRESRLLLYAGKPYFIRSYSTWRAPGGIYIHAFWPKLNPLTNPGQNIYQTMQICQFSPVDL